MKEYPILFSGPMIRAILEGRKTQTRRVIKLADGSLPDNDSLPACFDDGYRPPYIMDFSRTFPQWKQLDCPYGLPGDSLWVRETWQAMNQNCQWWHEVPRNDRPLYNWAWTNPVYPAYESLPPKWLPSIHMPRAACRITPTVVNVRVERLQDISEEDAKAEGVEPNCSGEWQTCPHCFNEGAHICLAEGEYIHYLRGMDELPAFSATESFESLWQSINGKRPACTWQDNPYVWVVEFAKVAQP